MSIINQLVEEVEENIIKDEGILNLLDKIPDQDREKWKKIWDIVVFKDKQYKRKQMLSTIQKYIKIDVNQAVKSEIKENELYIAMYNSDHYYLVYIKNVGKITQEIYGQYYENITIHGKHLDYDNLHLTFYFQYSHKEFRDCVHNGRYDYYRIIDEKLIEEEMRKKFDIN